MKTREDIFKEINIHIAEEGFGPGDEFEITDTPESAVRAAAYYVMVAEKAIQNRALQDLTGQAQELDMGY